MVVIKCESGCVNCTGVQCSSTHCVAVSCTGCSTTNCIISTQCGGGFHCVDLCLASQTLWTSLMMIIREKMRKMMILKMMIVMCIFSSPCNSQRWLGRWGPGRSFAVRISKIIIFKQMFRWMFEVLKSWSVVFKVYNVSFHSFPGWEVVLLKLNIIIQS